MHVTVVIPTYDRPEHLRRALAALAAQERRPDHVIVAARVDDTASWRAAEAYADELSLRVVPVRAAGYLPPLAAARAALPAATDVVIVCDDDAVPSPQAVARLVRHYRDPRVGGVCGALREHFDGRPAPRRSTRRVGTVAWTGRFWGNFECAFATSRPVDVEFMRGAWMSFRGAALAELRLPVELDRDAAVHYEVDLGLQLRARGWRIVFDPESIVRHDNAPRRAGSARDDGGAVRLRAAAHNATYIQLARLRGLKRAAALAFSFAVGDVDNWGVARALVHALLRRRPVSAAAVRAAYAGKLAAVGTWHRARRA